MLAGSDNVAADTEELTKAEREALMRVSLEEVRVAMVTCTHVDCTAVCARQPFALLCVQATERRKELQKIRALMSYYEQKARRTKKIKSKK